MAIILFKVSILFSNSGSALRALGATGVWAEPPAVQGRPLDPCQVEPSVTAPAITALSAPSALSRSPVMIYRFSRYSASPRLRGFFNKKRGRLLCVGDVRGPFPVSFSLQLQVLHFRKQHLGPVSKGTVLAAGKCENGGRHGRLRPMGGCGRRKWSARLTNYILKSSPAPAADHVTETRPGVAWGRTTLPLAARGRMSVCLQCPHQGHPLWTSDKFRPP